MNKTTLPVKDRQKINEIFAYLRGKSERNYIIAKLQLNTALRISDVIGFRVSDFVHEDGKCRKYLELIEKKTDKKKIIALNNTLQSAMKQYIEEASLNYNDYLFPSRKGTRHITTTQVHRIFNDVSKALQIEKFGTHSLRKTWGYFCYKETKNIALIMEVYNHSSEKVTLKYIGITQKDIDVMYMNIKF